MRTSLLLTVSALLPLGWATTGWAQESYRQSPPPTAQNSGPHVDRQAVRDTSSLQDDWERSMTQADEDAGKLRRRIVHLSNGMKIRGLARFEDGQWWLGPRKRARAIRAHLVEHVQEEKELLRTWKAKQKDSAQTRAGLAGWAFEAGLLKEGLRELDKALRSHQERSQALEVLAANRRFLPQPPPHQEQDAAQSTWERQWLWLQKRHTPAMETLAAQTWALAAQSQEVSRTADQTDPWMQALTDATAKGSAAQREFALHALREWRGERSAADLQRFALLDASERVRLHAGWLLGTLNNAQHVRPIIDLVTHKNEEVQVRATQALGQAGYAAAVPALVASLQSGASPNRVPHAHIFIGKQTAYVQDFDPEVAAGSAIADPIVNVLPSGVVLDVGVRSITIERHLIQVRRSLNQITGHRPGSSAKSWNRWLEKYSQVDADWRAPWPTPEEQVALRSKTSAPE